jgi:thiamine-phosphate pyrophosphorylase
MDLKESSALAMSGVTLITDRHRSRGRPVEEIVAAAVAGGVARVQIREKDLPTRDLVALVLAVRRVAGRARLFVNDRIDVALATGADGVHLGKSALPVAAARRVAPGLEIGYSAHELEEARAAERQGASFVTFSPVYETASEGSRGAAPQGIAALRDVCRALRIPVFALGGVTAPRVPELLAAGAGGVAVVSAITEAGDIEAAAREIVRRAQGAREQENSP